MLLAILIDLWILRSEGCCCCCCPRAMLLRWQRPASRTRSLAWAIGTTALPALAVQPLLLILVPILVLPLMLLVDFVRGVQERCSKSERHGPYT